MVTKAKNRLFKRISFGLWSVAFAVVGLLAFSTTTLVSAPKVSAKTASAVCAILDQGRVDCPTGVKDGKCYYKDLGNPDPNGSIQGFVEAPSCSNGIFQSALNPQITPAQDPALTQCSSTTSCDLVKKYVDPLINVLAAAVGVVVTISIVVGGIQYASSAGDPGKASAAKSRIRNAIIALVGFFLLYAVLQWLVPGGLLN
jgi:hypothetical protein